MVSSRPGRLLRTMSGSMIQQQPGIGLMSIVSVATGDWTDAWGLDKHLRSWGLSCCQGHTDLGGFCCHWGHSDIWTQAATEGISRSMFLLQLESMMLSMAGITTGGYRILPVEIWGSYWANPTFYWPWDSWPHLSLDAIEGGLVLPPSMGLLAPTLRSDGPIPHHWHGTARPKS